MAGQGWLLGEGERVMKGGLDEGEGDRAAARRGGGGGGEADGGDIGAYAVEMMPGKPDAVDPQLVRQPRLGQRLVDNRAVARRIAAIGKQEIAEPHGLPPHRSLQSRTDAAAAVTGVHLAAPGATTVPNGARRLGCKTAWLCS